VYFPLDLVSYDLRSLRARIAQMGSDSCRKARNYISKIVLLYPQNRPDCYRLVQMAGQQRPAMFRFQIFERRICGSLLGLSDTSVDVGSSSWVNTWQSTFLEMRESIYRDGRKGLVRNQTPF
jgi:hypothetical protein